MSRQTTAAVLEGCGIAAGVAAGLAVSLSLGLAILAVGLIVFGLAVERG